MSSNENFKFPKKEEQTSTKPKKKATVITVVVTALLLLIPALSGLLLVALLNVDFPAALPILYVLIVILAGIISYSSSNHKKMKAAIITVSGCMVVVIGAFLWVNFYKFYYVPSITMSQNLRFWDFIPYNDSPYISTLDDGEEVTLKFSADDELPRLDGATALIPVYCSIAQAVYPEQVEWRNYLVNNTTKFAYEGLIDGKSDVIFVAEPSKEQLQMAQDAGVEFNMYPIGYEAFVFIVNRKNPVSDLSLNQIKDIYTGKITNWKELGGKNKLIRPFQREKGSGSQTAFIKVMGKDVELLKPETTQYFDVMSGLVDVVADYQNHENAIGYSFRYYVESFHSNKNIKILKLNGIEPTKETIRNKTYPITDHFYAVTIKDRESENTKKLIEWIMSDQGQKLIEKTGYVSN